MVRAKFVCTGKEPNDEGQTISMLPVTSGSDENKEFYKWTPGGNVLLSTVNEAAADQFVVGKQYYVDFTLAE